MQAILQDAQQQQATDIVSINNRIWFRVLKSPIHGPPHYDL